MSPTLYSDDESIIYSETKLNSNQRWPAGRTAETVTQQSTRIEVDNRQRFVQALEQYFFNRMESLQFPESL